MAERHRLRALQVRVARHRRVRLLAGALEDRVRERDERSVRLGARVRDVEPERGRDLVVARAAGVDLPPDLAEQPLDRASARPRPRDRRRRAAPQRRRAPRASSASSRIPAACSRSACSSVPCTSYGSSSASSDLQERPHLRREIRADASGPQRHCGGPSSSGSDGRGGGSRLRCRCFASIAPRVGDVVDLHGELADPVGCGERGRAALHAQPLRVVRHAVAARVEDRVVVAAPQLDRHLAGDDGRDPALQRVAQHQRLRVEPAALVEQPAEPPAVLGVALERRLVVDRASAAARTRCAAAPCPAPRRCRGSSPR